MSDDSGPAITIDGLTKTYGPVTALDAIRFDVERGQVFGLMGHNGAGKTTLIRVLLGLVRPSGGGARVLGHDVVSESLEVRRLAGFLPAEFSLPGEMTARRFLRYVASMFSLPGDEAARRTDELLALFDLAGDADRHLSGFSSGMTQKVGLAQALVNRPRILFLDEPTSGLDPLARHDFLDHIGKLAREDGVTVLFSTHILSDIEAICERVAVLHEGKLLARGSLEQLKAEHGAASMDELYLALVRGPKAAG